MKTVWWLAAALAASIASAQDVDHRALGERLLELWRAGDFAGVVALGEKHQASLLGSERPVYLPLACVARALPRVGRHEDALVWYERTLQASARPHVVTEYVRAITRTDRLDRGKRFLASLDGGSAAVADGSTTLRVLALIRDGDAARRAGMGEKARKRYRRALALHDEGPWHVSEPRRLSERERKAATAYTYRQLYATADGHRRQVLLVRTGLPAKLAAVAPVTTDAHPVTVRVAALVVPRTDVTWSEAGEEHHESLTLDDAELASIKDAWAVATAAAAAYSGHRVTFDTEWTHLDGVTLTGLTDRLWNGLVRQRHLNPARLDPPQHERFEGLVGRFDVIVFAWPRGRAAAAYGGGGIRLPGPRGLLPRRGGIRSLSAEPHVCLHELLHVVERRVKVPPVHGPSERPMEVFTRLGIRDEMDWYRHVTQSVEDWAAVPHVARNP